MKKIALLVLSVATSSLFGISYTSSDIVNEPLNLEALPSDPMKGFQQWYNQAEKALGKLDASTMVLGTASSTCRPSTRGMLIKNIKKDGLTFYGDDRSLKFHDLKENPYASVTFYWSELQRQVTLSGPVIAISKNEAKKVFKMRSKPSQATSTISKQGSLLKNRGELLNKHQNILDQYKELEIEMPDHWTGFKLIPNRIEFWQAGSSLLHSRVEYQQTNGKWKKQLLHP